METTAPQTTQAHRPVAALSTLGADRLLFCGLRGRDELGHLSAYEVDLLSESGSIRIADVLGQPLGIRIDVAGGEPRYFNGYVTRFAHRGWRGRYAVYAATLRHWPWLMTRATNCRIFQDKTVVEILKEVFADYPAEYDFDAVGPREAMPYCVQYGETDFDFVSRLMEETGIYYFFRQARDSHTLVLADSYAAHGPAAGHARLRYRSRRGEGALEGGFIHDWSAVACLESGKQSVADFDFEKATSSESGILRATSSSDAAGHGRGGQGGHERYDYPGHFASRDAGRSIAHARLEALAAGAERFTGTTAVRTYAPGVLFDLVEHPREEQNGGYLVVAADYEIAYGGYDVRAASAGASSASAAGTASATRAAPTGLAFDCRIESISKKIAFRSATRTPRPCIRGPQTAFVVGKAGEEIWTDRYGRVKVQFHWDRKGARDERSSCWVRVAQPLAGKRWGAMFLPRIGQEVVVEFLDGDPDRPLVTGCVYNAGAMPPYPLPQDATRTTIRSSSSKGGGAYNEIRFEDKAGSEQLYFHAGRNHDHYVANDALLHVGKDRHARVAGNDLSKIDGDRSDSVGGSHKGRIGGTYSLDVARDTQCKSGTDLALGAGRNVDLKGGLDVTIEAGMTLTLKAGNSTIVLGPTGISINGTTVSIDGSAMVGINGGGGAAGSSAQEAQPQSPDAPAAADDGKSS
ncbi:MAG TPA: type VI secretion system tip protein TssI/VgrG [Burkholderiaceae bacterium]|nr:type VI secretion system tip protein TssI/VgrG [Burkholderiaceae bacterium]